jgi:hypothetical protein
VVVVMVVVVTHHMMVVMAHRMVAPHRMVMVAHRVVNAMMMHTGRRRAGRQGQNEGRRERQGDEFQGLSPGFWCVPESGFGHRQSLASRQMPKGYCGLGSGNLGLKG